MTKQNLVSYFKPLLYGFLIYFLPKLHQSSMNFLDDVDNKFLLRILQCIEDCVNKSVKINQKEEFKIKHESHKGLSSSQMFVHTVCVCCLDFSKKERE